MIGFLRNYPLTMSFKYHPVSFWKLSHFHSYRKVHAFVHSIQSRFICRYAMAVSRVNYFTWLQTGLLTLPKLIMFYFNAHVQWNRCCKGCVPSNHLIKFKVGPFRCSNLVNIWLKNTQNRFTKFMFLFSD